MSSTSWFCRWKIPVRLVVYCTRSIGMCVYLRGRGQTDVFLKAGLVFDWLSTRWYTQSDRFCSQYSVRKSHTQSKYAHHPGLQSWLESYKLANQANQPAPSVNHNGFFCPTGQEVANQTNPAPYRSSTYFIQLPPQLN